MGFQVQSSRARGLFTIWGRMRSDLECVARNRGGVAYLIAKWFRCVVLVFSPKAFGPENQKKIVRGAVVYKQATPLRGFRGRRCQSRAGYLGFTLPDSNVKEPEVFLQLQFFYTV